MATEVKVPSLGESITSGIIAAWHVQDGDFVKKDQIVYELETDKITSEGLAELDGQISLKASEGDEVEIGQVIAEIDETAAAPEEPIETKTVSESEKEAAAIEEEQQPQKQSEAISPSVRRIASESSLDPATVDGTGKAGRVTKGDMLEALEKKSKQTADTAATSKTAPKPDPSHRSTRKRLSPMRQKIAERLVMAQQEAAMLTTFNEVDLSEIKALRAKHQEKFVEKHGVKLGFMSFFVKAAVHALKEVPAINAQLDGDELVQNHYYDIGIAVSTEKGLLVPVARDCDSQSLAEIEMQILNYAKKAREGKIELSDLQGGVFTITNGGIFGSMLSTPILNAPQSAILGMHAIQDRPVAVKGEVVIRPMMYLALSYDHRIVDGKEAVTFLVKIKEALEDPTRLLLEI